MDRILLSVHLYNQVNFFGNSAYMRFHARVKKAFPLDSGNCLCGCGCVVCVCVFALNAYSTFPTLAL